MELEDEQEVNSQRDKGFAEPKNTRTGCVGGIGSVVSRANEVTALDDPSSPNNRDEIKVKMSCGDCLPRPISTEEDPTVESHLNVWQKQSADVTSPMLDESASQQHLKSTNVIVNFVPHQMREAELFDLFSQCGEVVAARIIYNAEGRSKGYAFVRFRRVQAAVDAVERLNGRNVYGKSLKVSFAAPRDEHQRHVELGLVAGPTGGGGGGVSSAPARVFQQQQLPVSQHQMVGAPQPPPGVMISSSLRHHHRQQLAPPAPISSPVYFAAAPTATTPVVMTPPPYVPGQQRQQQQQPVYFFVQQQAAAPVAFVSGGQQMHYMPNCVQPPSVIIPPQSYGGQVPPS